MRERILVNIRYTDSLEGISVDHLRGGFFQGWPNPPAPEAHLRILQGSFAIVLALVENAPEESNQVVGFITSISDGVSATYIPHLEVLPTYRGYGIGSELVHRLVGKLRNFYMVDLICDDNVKPFYERLGFRPNGGMILRNYDRQSCD